MTVAEKPQGASGCAGLSRESSATVNGSPLPKKLHGRAFYESLGSPKYIVAPMVDQSEFAWRMLTRSFMPPSDRGSILAYTPMLHARLYAESEKYRDTHFQPTTTKPAPGAEAGSAGPRPYLDGNEALDRPLIVQFCANDPDLLLAAARQVVPYCDAVDLNLGCPQGIARKGRYGSFLQEDQELIYKLIRTLHDNLPIPVTAKIRILETPEETLAYARNVLAAGASFLTVHGRRREQKGHETGLADWEMIRFLRDSLPLDTVLFANGNILQHGDMKRCLEATGADAIMSAEGNLSDPALFAPIPEPGRESREYWRGRDGRGGWRLDAIVRRYLDILHRHVDGRDPPERRPLFVSGDDAQWLKPKDSENDADAEGPPRKRQKKADKADNSKTNTNGKKKDGRGDGGSGFASPNYVGVQAHLFHLLRHFVTRHTDVRDALARARLGVGVAGYEKILDLVESRVAEGLLEYERDGTKSADGIRGSGSGADQHAEKEGKDEDGDGKSPLDDDANDADIVIRDDPESSTGARRRCSRPWWVAQPIIRPLPKEAMAKGAIQLSKKQLEKLEKEKGNGNVEAEVAPQSQPPAREEEDKKKKPEAQRVEARESDTGCSSEPALQKDQDGSDSGAGGTPAALEKTADFQRSGLVSG